MSKPIKNQPQPLSGERLAEIERFRDDCHPVTGILAVGRVHDALDDLLAEVERLKAALRDAADQVAELESDLGGATARIAELERPAVEAKRNEIRDSFAELAAAARETRDYEGAFNIECDLREREQQWKHEDEEAAR